MFRQAYRELSTSEDAEIPHNKTTTKWGRILALVCVLETLVLVFLIAILWNGATRKTESQNGSWEEGLLTDYWELQGLFSLEQKEFRNHPRLRPNKTAQVWEWQVEWENDTRRYAGSPDPEMDEAWDEMLAAINLNRTGETAKPIMNKTYGYPDGNYMMGLEVFHALHCLNMIRRTLYPRYYPEYDLNDRSFAAHISHCVDYLRQYVQCNADLAPMYFEYHGPREGLVLAEHTKHTCRNFDQIRQWIMDQNPIWFSTKNVSQRVEWGTSVPMKQEPTSKANLDV